MDAYGDPIPPGHGEPDGASPRYAGSDVYGDESWELVRADWKLTAADMLPDLEDIEW